MPGSETKFTFPDMDGNNGYYLLGPIILDDNITTVGISREGDLLVNNASVSSGLDQETINDMKSNNIQICASPAGNVIVLKNEIAYRNGKSCLGERFSYSNGDKGAITYNIEEGKVYIDFWTNGSW
jgi:hypothetical protein